MTLVTDIQRAVKAGVGALTGIAESVTYRSAADPTYNTTTGALTTTMTDVTVSVVFAGYRRDEIDGEVIRPEDQKCLIPTKDFSPTPGVNDQITRASGEVWSVQGIGKDPASALWVLNVRRP